MRVLKAEGIRGGVRGGVRGDVQGGVRGGVRGAEASGVRGGVRGASARVEGHASSWPDDGGRDRARPSSESRATSHEKRQASDGELAFAFEVIFLMPKRSAKDGDNSIRTRVRPGKHQDVPLVEVKTTVKIKVSSQPSAISDQPGSVAEPSGSAADSGKPSADSFVIEIEETSIALNDVELPDLDGNGVATLTEVAAIIGNQAVGGGPSTSSGRTALADAIAIASDATSTQKPTQEQVQAAFQNLATKLETKVKDDFKAAGVAPPASVKIEIKEMDLTPPDTAFGKTPLLVTRDTSHVFEFLSTEAGSTFMCQLDVGTPTPCVSPVTLSLVTEGVHTYIVYAVDKAGNKDATPASVTWTVDTKAPAIAISGQPSAISNQTSISFSFTCSDPGTLTPGPCSFACKLDQPLAPGTFAACSSPLTLSALGGLSKGDGSYTFTVQGSDAAGNIGSASHAWTIDTTPPTLTLTDTNKVAPSTFSASASFSFASSETGATFQCKRDAAAFSACTSPMSYSGLATGSHTFEVGGGRAGITTRSNPARRTWQMSLKHRGRGVRSVLTIPLPRSAV